MSSPNPLIHSQFASRVIELCRARARVDDRAEDERLRADLWLVVAGLLTVQVRRHGAPRLGPEERLDLVADKALEVMSRIDQGEWRPEDGGPGRVVNYLASVARFGVIDRFRALDREPQGAVDDPDRGGAEHELPGTAPWSDPPPPDPARDTHAAEFAAALEECLDRLPERDRRVWVLRVLHDLRAREIAAHPEVRSSSTAIDMVISRCRKRLGACMTARGFVPTDIPPGAFTRLWETLTMKK